MRRPIAIQPLLVVSIAASAFVFAVLCVLPVAAFGASRYLSPSGSDAGGCGASAPCRSVSYAYGVSSPGDVVELAGGSYGGQSVPDRGARVGPAVEFRAAPGATVSMSALSIDGDWVSVRDVAVSGGVSVAAEGNGVADVRLVGVSARTLWLQNAHRVAFVGGSFGGNENGPTVQIAGDPASSVLSFDGVDFHDAVATNDTVHMECIWVAAVQGFTVRNSIFRNCAYFNIFFTKLNGLDPKDVLLENNVFEQTKQWNGQGAPYAINVANWLTKAENFVFRNNVFGGDVAIQPTTISNMRLVGNIGEVASCKSGVSYSHNVFTAASCSATDKRVAGAMGQFVNPAGHDWRLKAGAAAIDAGNPNDAPATDRNGYARIGAPDAGAHEYGATGPPPVDPNPPVDPDPDPPVDPDPDPPVDPDPDPPVEPEPDPPVEPDPPLPPVTDPAPTDPVVPVEPLAPAVVLPAPLAPSRPVQPARRGGPRLKLLGMSGGRVCDRRTTSGCRSVARLRVSVSRRTLLNVTVKRLRGRHARRVSSTDRRVGRGVNVLLLRAEGWRGRYGVTVRAVDASGKATNPVRLRFSAGGGS
jgi:hypothetical protein